MKAFSERTFHEVATVIFVNCRATQIYNGLTCRHVYDTHRTNPGQWESTLFELLLRQPVRAIKAPWSGQCQVLMRYDRYPHAINLRATAFLCALKNCRLPQALQSFCDTITCDDTRSPTDFFYCKWTVERLHYCYEKKSILISLLRYFYQVGTCYAVKSLNITILAVELVV